MTTAQHTKLLILTYYWPPSGGPAVQRWLSFTNELHRHGFKPYVLTVSEESANYPALDPSLVQQVHPETVVEKTATSELFWIYKKYIGKGKAPSAGFANEANPSLLQRFSRFVRGNFFLPDPRKSWNKHALPKAKEIIEREGIKLVITAGPPHSTHLMGLTLKKELGITWIADFHDAWTDVWYYDKLYHTALAKRLDARLEREVLEEADKVLTVSEYLKKALAEKSSRIPEEKIHVLSMGYDEKLFAQASAPPQDRFIITYTGTMDANYEPQILFRALREVKQRVPGVPFLLRFVGLVHERVIESAREMGMGEHIEVIPYVPHAQSVRYLLGSTALLLVSPKVRSEEIIIPGKIYEYLATRKPIINIGSLGTDSARIVSLCEAGGNFDRNMDAELTQWLVELFRRWQENPDLDLKGENRRYLQYSRTAEAEKLAALLTGA